VERHPSIKRWTFQEDFAPCFAGDFAGPGPHPNPKIVHDMTSRGAVATMGGAGSARRVAPPPVAGKDKMGGPSRITPRGPCSQVHS